MTRQLFHDAFRLHQEEKLDEAKTLYEKVLIQDPQHLDALHLLGLLAHQSGSLAEAESLFVTAIRLRPDFSQIYLSYAQSLCDMLRFDEALACYSKALFLKPNDPHAYADRGMLYQTLKRFPEALSDFDKAISIELNYALAHNNRGIVLGELRRLSEAIESYEYAIKFDPTNALAHSNKAAALNSLGRPAEAITSYDLAIHFDPNHADFHYNKANSLLKLGEVDQAIESWTRSIELNPQFAEAHFNRANALFLSHKTAKAVIDYDTAIALLPDYAEVYASCGEALKELQRPNDALISFNKAIQLAPNSSGAYYNKANFFNSVGSHEQALVNYHIAITINPNHAEAHYNKAILLKSLGRAKDATDSYEKAIRAHPTYPEALLNYGISLMEAGRYAEALESNARAIAARPNYAEAYNNQGLIHHNLKNYTVALAQYQKAFLLRQDYPEAFLNLGVTLMAMQQYNEALIIFEKAIALKPDYSHAYNNRALTLKDAKRFEPAIESCDQALAINPDYAEALNNCGVILKELTRLDEAIINFQKALEISPQYFTAHSNLLFTMNYIEHLPQAVRTQEAIRFGKNLTRHASQKFESWGNLEHSEKLKIGFVSGDLQNHPVGYFLEGLLSQIDKTKFHLIGYSTDPHEDELTRRIKDSLHLWRPIYERPDYSAARMIHEDGVQILIDLSGHTAKNRLPVFAYKPAPVQISWLGYFATTGVEQIDFILGDPYVTPPGEESHFTEAIKRLPETYLCFTPPTNNIEVAPLPALRNGHITFGSFNNYSKISNSVLTLWARVLASVEGSKLFMKAAQFRDGDLVRNIKDQFLDLGITHDRLIFEGQTNREDYFKAYNHVDIALDPFPYPGGTTSVEGLWMGVPVIAKKGSRFIGHNGETIAHNTGQSDWIAFDETDYVKKAVHYASDLGTLALIRQGLRKQLLSSPLCDAKRFSQNFENALNEIWLNFLHQIQDHC